MNDTNKSKNRAKEPNAKPITSWQSINDTMDAKNEILTANTHP